MSLLPGVQKGILGVIPFNRYTRRGGWFEVLLDHHCSPYLPYFFNLPHSPSTLTRRRPNPRITRVRLSRQLAFEAGSTRCRTSGQLQRPLVPIDLRVVFA